MRPSSAAWSSSCPICGCCCSSSSLSSSSSRSRCRRRRSPCRPIRRCSTVATACRLLAQLKQLSIDNYTWLTQDALYFNAYLTRPHDRRDLDAADLLVGYPIAYGMARAPATIRADAADAGDPAVLDLVPDPRLRLDRHPQARGLLNSVLLAAGIIDQPLVMMNTYYGDLHRHRLFLSAVHDPAALFDSGKDGLFADRSRPGSRLPADQRLLEDHLPAVAAGRHCRLHCWCSSRPSANSSFPTCSAGRRR